MESRQKPPDRINEDGERQVAPTWERLVDRQHRRPPVVADEPARLGAVDRR